jgi:PBP1b-binding outer membrane lipoprotein LpoB
MKKILQISVILLTMLLLSGCMAKVKLAKEGAEYVSEQI